MNIPVFISFLLFLTGFSGLVFFLFNEKTLIKTREAGLLFALGTLGGTVFFHLIPDYFSNDFEIINFLMWVVPTFLVWFLPSLISKKNNTSAPSVAALLIGDAIHNAITSLLLISVLMTSPESGIILLPAIFLHEIPHKAGNFGIIHFSGISRNKSLLLCLLSSSTFFTGLLLFVTDIKINQEIVIPIVIGTLLYTFINGLIQAIRFERNGKLFLWLSAGFLFMFLIHYLSGHNH